MNTATPLLPSATRLLSRCVSVDLEVNPKTAEVFAFAAVRYTSGSCIRSGREDLSRALDRLEDELAGGDHCIGHNIVRHDLPHLAALRPRLSKLCRAPIDTLWLNPLAFPRNPYHHLVKHHLDGRLQAGHQNDPEKDAQLVFELLEDQLREFGKLQSDSPDVLTAYHYLTTLSDGSAGFDALFQACRLSSAPSVDEAEQAIRRMLEHRACIRQIDEMLGEISSPRKGWPAAYVSNGVQKGPPIGVEEGPPFQII